MDVLKQAKRQAGFREMRIALFLLIFVNGIIITFMLLGLVQPLPLLFVQLILSLSVLMRFYMVGADDERLVRNEIGHILNAANAELKELQEALDAVTPPLDNIFAPNYPPGAFIPVKQQTMFEEMEETRRMSSTARLHKKYFQTHATITEAERLLREDTW